jgi:hypothetical protein
VGGGTPSLVVPFTGEISEHFFTTKDAVIFAASTKKGEAPSGSSYIFSVPFKGGSTTTLATTTGLAGYLATDGTSVYFADDDGTKSVPLAGGSVTKITSLSDFSFVPVGTNLILADFQGETLLSVPLAGGSTTTLASGQDGPIYPLACGDSICWMSAGHITYNDADEPSPPVGTLEQRAPDAAVSALSTSVNLGDPFSFVFDGSFFYVLGGDDGMAVTKVPAAGGTPQVMAAGSPGSGLAMDEACLYWADQMGGIYSLAKSATGPFTPP